MAAELEVKHRVRPHLCSDVFYYCTLPEDDDHSRPCRPDVESDGEKGMQ